MKRFYYAYQCKFPDGKECSGTYYYTSDQNLLKQINQFGGAYHSEHGGYSRVTVIQLCETKREADTTAQIWNQTFKENGTLAFT